MTERDANHPGARTGDDEFARTAGDLLRRSAEDIDGATASRLSRARRTALGELSRHRPRSPWLVPALFAAAVGALAVALWVTREPDMPAAPPGVESAADMDVLLTADNLEMLEDLEFYAWLDADLSDAELRAELEPTG